MKTFVVKLPDRNMLVKDVDCESALAQARRLVASSILSVRELDPNALAVLQGS
jgi:hypothetical protein